MDKSFLDVLLAEYHEKYHHVQHIQAMRASYFNFFIIVIGFCVAAIASIYAAGKAQAFPGLLPSIGVIMFLISMLTLLRSERWGGHISHDLRAVRVIQKKLATSYQYLRDIEPDYDNPLTSLQFDRKPWDREKTIDPLAAIVGASLSGAFIGVELSVALESSTLIRLLASFFGLLIGAGVAYWQWTLEVKYLEKRHQNCCINPKETY